MKSKYLLLAAALLIACGDDSSSSPANDTPANDTPAQNGNGDNHRAEPSYTDCIQTVFEFARIEFEFYDDFGGLVIDSMYWDKGDANNRGKSIYTYKAYWTGTHLDSTFESNLRDGEWAYQTTVNTKETRAIREGNTSTLISTEDGISDTITVYFDGDSLATTSRDEDGEYTSIYVLRNDTIFRPTHEDIIVKDENDINTCYQRELRDGEWISWDRYETGVKDGMIVLTKIYVEDGLDHKAGTYFMFRR
jgi:VCBS repeat-containing protein